MLGNGNGRMGQSHVPVAVAGNLTFRSLTAGADHLCGVTIDERLFCWGHNGEGEFGVGTTRGSTTPVRAAPGLRFAAAEAGNDFTCALTASGAAWCFGYAGLGNLGDGQRIAYGNTQSTTPVKVVGDLTFRSLTLAQQYACGLTVAGRAYCWGRNGGRFGNGNGGDASTPAPAAGELAFRSLSAGATHACGVATDDAVWCWGANTYGQLGVDLRNGSTRPVRVAGDLTAAEVSAADVATGSAGYSCAIAVDRLTTWCWGKNDVGQLGTGTPSPRDAVTITPSVVLGQRPLPRDSSVVAR
jgi:alpha-tubulin suppressor-like RCC1 family protein